MLQYCNDMCVHIMINIYLYTLIDHDRDAIDVPTPVPPRFIVNSLHSSDDSTYTRTKLMYLLELFVSLYTIYKKMI